MPAIKLHLDALENVNDFNFLASLAMGCILRQINPDYLCSIIYRLIQKKVFSAYFDPTMITDYDCERFFREQFIRATTILNAQSTTC